MTLFAFRAHMHMHGVSQAGYLQKDNTTMKIAIGGPTTPQKFITMPHEVVVDNGDVLATRCTFNTEMENEPVYIGILSTMLLHI